MAKLCPKSALATVAVVLVLAVGCGSSSNKSSGAGGTTTTGAGASSTTTAASTASGSATSGGGSDYYGYAPSSTAAGAASTTSAAAAAATGTVSLTSTALGKVLVDANGMTLYVFTKDTQGSPSVCSGSCATSWPPLVADNPTAGSGLDASKLSVLARSDGTKQVAYNGWPLYRYSKDAKAGDLGGEGVGGNWFVVGADGNAIRG